MAGVVYSTRFVSVAPASTNTVYYTVPAGFVAVVRTMTFAYAEPARANGVATVLLAAANSRIWIVQATASTVGSAVWSGRLVLPAGETLRAAYTGTTGQWLTISGYLLSLP
jgi:hypothetical protein